MVERYGVLVGRYSCTKLQPPFTMETLCAGSALLFQVMFDLKRIRLSSKHPSRKNSRDSPREYLTVLSVVSCRDALRH
jgi:hypothetical protein